MKSHQDLIDLISYNLEAHIPYNPTKTFLKDGRVVSEDDLESSSAQLGKRT